MTGIETLRAETRRLEKELRRERQRAAALESYIGALAGDLSDRAVNLSKKEAVERSVEMARLRSGHMLGGLGGRLSSSVDAVYKAMGKSIQDEVATYEELAEFPRSAIATAHGVGPKAMAVLDARLVDYGLEWAAEDEAVA